jgi:hypothetical protein
LFQFCSDVDFVSARIILFHAKFTNGTEQKRVEEQKSVPSISIVTRRFLRKCLIHNDVPTSREV